MYILDTVGELGVSSMTLATSLMLYCITRYGLCKGLIIRPWLLFYGVGFVKYNVLTPLRRNLPVLLLCSCTCECNNFDRLLFSRLPIVLTAVLLTLGTTVLAPVTNLFMSGGVQVSFTPMIFMWLLCIPCDRIGKLLPCCSGCWYCISVYYGPTVHI